MNTVAIRAMSAWLVQMLEVAFSRRMCCSRVASVRQNARLPRESTVCPTSRPGIWVLLARRQRQAERPVAARIHGLSHQPAGHLAHVFFARGDDAGVRSAIAWGNRETLQFAQIGRASCRERV